MAIETWALGALGAEKQFRLQGVDELSVHHARLTEGVSAGVDVLTLQNGPLRVRVVPTRGMGVLDMHYKDVRIGWESPVPGPVHPAYVPLGEATGWGWLDGFDELIVRCGLESNGAPVFDEQGRLVYPLHGRIANKPARDVQVTIDGEAREIRIVGIVEEIRFHFAKLRMTTTLATRVGEQGFRLRDEVENLSAKPMEMQLLYHINYGAPLLAQGARIVAPVKTVVPGFEGSAAGVVEWDRFAAPQVDFSEQVYFVELLADDDNKTQTLLKNSPGDRGVRLGFNKEQLPYFTLWKNTVAQADGYVTGFEPGTNFPNARGHEAAQGRVVTIPPGGKQVFDLDMAYLRNADEVQGAESEIARLQGAVVPTIFSERQPGWCAL